MGPFYFVAVLFLIVLDYCIDASSVVNPAVGEYFDDDNEDRRRIDEINKMTSGKKFARNVECDLYQRYIPGGAEIGIYTGVHMDTGTYIEQGVGIPIKYPHTQNELHDYVVGANETHGLILLGYLMLYNSAMEFSRVLHSQTYVRGNYIRFPRSAGGGESQDVLNIATVDIWPGSQLLRHYGSDWFADRSITPIDFVDGNIHGGNYVNDILADPYVLPGCPTQSTQIIDDTLYAIQPFKKGQIIEISRAILIAERFLDVSKPLNYFSWYRSSKQGLAKFTGNPGYGLNGKYDPKEAYGVLLLGRGALYSATPSGETDISNVSYDWWDVPSGWKIKSSRVSTDGDAGSEGMAAERKSSKGIACQTRMFVAFTAARDISVGEKLVVPLSVDKRSHYKYASEEFSSPCLYHKSDEQKIVI